MLGEFRAWDKEENKYFVPVFNAHQGELRELLLTQKGHVNLRTLAGLHHVTDKFIVEFSTLKTDSTGKTIFDGDVVTTTRYPWQDDGEYNYHGIIHWSKEYAAFFIQKHLVNPDKSGISHGISEPIMDMDMSEFTILGNIHQMEL